MRSTHFCGGKLAEACDEPFRLLSTIARACIAGTSGQKKHSNVDSDLESFFRILTPYFAGWGPQIVTFIALLTTWLQSWNILVLVGEIKTV